MKRLKQRQKQTTEAGIAKTQADEAVVAKTEAATEAGIAKTQADEAVVAATEAAEAAVVTISPLPAIAEGHYNVTENEDSGVISLEPVTENFDTTTDTTDYQNVDSDPKIELEGQQLADFIAHRSEPNYRIASV